MRNTITFRDSSGEPQTGLAVELYEWQAGSPFYDSKIGDFNDVGNGQYYIDVTDSVRGTILVDSVVQTAFIGVLMNGNLGLTSILPGSITTEMLADDCVTNDKIDDGSVTPVKTTFVEDF